MAICKRTDRQTDRQKHTDRQTDSNTSATWHSLWVSSLTNSDSEKASDEHGASTRIARASTIETMWLHRDTSETHRVGAEGRAGAAECLCQDQRMVHTSVTFFQEPVGSGESCTHKREMCTSNMGDNGCSPDHHATSSSEIPSHETALTGSTLSNTTRTLQCVPDNATAEHAPPHPSPPQPREREHLRNLKLDHFDNLSRDRTQNQLAHTFEILGMNQTT